MTNKVKGGMVVIGYCHPGTVEAAFHESMLATILADVSAAGGPAIGQIIPVRSSANVSAARNAIVRQFLAGPGEWLWMLDADMMFAPDTLDQLLAAAHPVHAPVVGGLCFGLDSDGSLYPTLYAILPDDVNPVGRYDQYPENELLRVDATGAACILIHRTVLENIRERAGHDWSPVFPWFQERDFVSAHAQTPVGEDVTFCLRAASCGHPVHVHTGIEIGHVKQQVLTAALYRRTRQVREAAS